MRKLIWIFAVTLIALGLRFEFPAKVRAQMPASNTNRTPVLIELFTSEGCSSCPPADLLLQKLLSKQPVTGAEVIALEAHVDYWNSLGWKDPYSSSDWTERQQGYSANFGNDPYTPELVVDGRANFVGSNRNEAETEIARAALIPKARLTITSAGIDAKGAHSFSISSEKLPASTNKEDAEVWLAIAEDGLRSSVNAGENSGSVLTHVATLRSLHKIGAAQKTAEKSYEGVASVNLNPAWKADRLRVIAFVQEKRTRQILAAASIPLPN